MGVAGVDAFRLDGVVGYFLGAFAGFSDGGDLFIWNFVGGLLADFLWGELFDFRFDCFFEDFAGYSSDVADDEDWDEEAGSVLWAFPRVSWAVWLGGVEAGVCVIDGGILVDELLDGGSDGVFFADVVAADFVVGVLILVSGFYGLL